MHILLAWEMGAGYGHLGRLIPLAKAFKAAGHEVTLAARQLENVWASQNPPFDRVVPAPNARAVPFDQESRTFSDIIRPSGFANGRMVAALARGWWALFDLLQPDAVVCEHAFNAVFAARARGLPVARLGTGFTVPRCRPDGGLAAIRRWQPHDPVDCQAADDALLEVLKEASALLSIDPPEALSDVFSYGEEFVQTWPELDHMGLQSDRFYYGPMVGLGGTTAPPWPDGYGPKTVVYLHDSHPHRAVLFEALNELGWPTLYHSRTRPEGPVAQTVHYSAEPLAMAKVLPHADIVINHASHGTCADAMRFGCKLFLMPDVLERFLVATQLVSAGLAQLPPAPEPTAAQMIAGLERLHQSPLANTQQIKARYGAYDPVAAAAELAEDLLAFFV